jgi:glycosyltransferase involved in cell wall biosynthesis
VIHHFGSPYQPISEIFQRPYSLQYLKHWLAKNAILARFGVPKDRICVVGTEFQSGQLLRLGVPENKIKVVPWGITPEHSKRIARDQARQRYGLLPGPMLGYLGHFSPIKGVPLLIAAFSRLLERLPDARLALAWSGKGADSAKVHRMLRDSTLRNRVSLLGVVEPGTFLSALDVCVLPYVHTSIPHFPLVILEAFAVGTPVITADVGGLREIVSDGSTGLLVPRNSQSALEDAMATLLGDEPMKRSISANQLFAFESRYCASAVAQDLRELM